MRIAIITICATCILLSGCSGKYYAAVSEMNQAIAESNQAVAEVCANALDKTKDPAAIVAISLTTCQGQQKFIPVQAPERPSETITSILSAATPLGIVGLMGSTPRASNYTVGGDYVQNTGDGSASTSRPVTHPTHVIVPAE
jgi:hypothetical protein